MNEQDQDKIMPEAEPTPEAAEQQPATEEAKKPDAQAGEAGPEEPQAAENGKKQTDGQRLMDDGKKLLDDGRKMFDDSREIIADNLKYYMKKMQVTSTEVCKDLGIRVSTFSDWLNQKSFPRIEKIDKLAEYFGIKKSDLIEVRPNAAPAKPVAPDQPVEAAVLPGMAAGAASTQALEQAIARSYNSYLRKKMEPNAALVQDLVYHLLLAQAEATFPLDLRLLTYEQNIVFETYEDYGKNSGVELDVAALPAATTTWIADHDTYLLLYRQGLATAERNWALAREIAHIQLGHGGLRVLDEKQKREVELFALELLLPVPVVAALADKGLAMELGVLRDTFQVAEEAAKLRCENWPAMAADLPQGQLAKQVAERYAAWVALVCLR